MCIVDAQRAGKARKPRCKADCTTKKGATTVSDLKKTLVHSFLDKRDIFALRQSNQTLLVPFSRGIADSDKAMLTDKYGHRYSRDTSLEHASSHMVFTII